jgi:hypothetical protein
MGTVAALRLSPNRILSRAAPELPRPRRDPMAMELYFDYVFYMWIMGILMVLVAVVGYFVVGSSLREHFRQREERMAHSSSRPYPWDDNPDLLGHG